MRVFPGSNSHAEQSRSSSIAWIELESEYESPPPLGWSTIGDRVSAIDVLPPRLRRPIGSNPRLPSLSVSLAGRSASPRPSHSPSPSPIEEWSTRSVLLSSLSLSSKVRRGSVDWSTAADNRSGVRTSERSNGEPAKSKAKEAKERKGKEKESNSEPNDGRSLLDADPKLRPIVRSPRPWWWWGTLYYGMHMVLTNYELTTGGVINLL